MGDNDPGKVNNPDDGEGADGAGGKAPDLPEKLQGKSAEDIAQMYIDLEKKATTDAQKAKEFAELAKTLQPYADQIEQLVQSGGKLPTKADGDPSPAPDNGGGKDEFFEKYGIEASAVLGLVLPELKKELGGLVDNRVGPLVQKHQSELDDRMRGLYGEENFLRMKTQGANVLKAAGITPEEAYGVIANRLGIKAKEKKKAPPPPDNPQQGGNLEGKGGGDMSDEDVSKTLMDRLMSTKPSHSILRPAGGSK